MFLILFLLMSKNQSNKLVLNIFLFIKFLKLNGKLLEKHTWLKKRKGKENNQYPNLKVSRHYQRSILLLKKTGLKLISRKEKMVFTTCCFNDTFMVSPTPMKWYFMFPLEVPKNPIWFIFILMPLKSNIFNMTRIIVYSVYWNLLCLIPENMLHKRLLPLDLNHTYIVHRWIIWMGYRLPIKLWHIVLCRIVVIRWPNEKNRIIWYLNDISDHVILVQLVETSGNVNQAVGITVCWIYDSNYKISLPLIK